jgi:adenylate cyclase
MHASELVDSLFDEALRLNPNEFNGWMWGGWTKVLLGEHRTAVNYLQRALRLSPLDPRNFFAENVLGFAHFFLGEYELGASCAIAASRHHPDYAPNLRVAMACYALSGDTAAARNLWQQLVLLSPSDRISTQKILGVFRRVEDRVKVAQAYRIAGMPE